MILSIARLGELAALAGDSRVAGAIALGGDTRPPKGVADFGPLGRIRARYSLLDEGEPRLTSSLGVHAAETDGVMHVACGPDGEWGRLSSAWVLEAIGGHLEACGVALSRLPPIGCLRLDDFPGTAELQAKEEAHSDEKQRRRARKMIRAATRSDGILNLAIPCRALEGGSIVPLDEVWPESIAQLRRGVEDGALETVCHGMLHLDAEVLRRGEIEYREFGALDEAEARRRIDIATEWMKEILSEPATFVAPAWGYSAGALAELRRREMPHWLPPRVGPLVDGWAVTETLHDAPPGLVGLDYKPIAALARLGMPPVVVLHGRNLDSRHAESKPGMMDAARLFLKPDLARLLELDGVRWIGAGETFEQLRAWGETPAN